MIQDLPRFFVLPCLFILGCCIGSFLNVCIHRFPSKYRLWDQLKSLASHGSGCPRCAASILWRDNIPLLGWLLLKGRCRNCQKPISWRYPLIELLTGVMFVVVYQMEMPPNFWSGISQPGLFTTDGPQAITQFHNAAAWMHVRCFLHIAMVCCLIVATFIDLELRIIPDGCTVPMMLLALVVSFAFSPVWIVPVWFQDMSIVTTLRNISPDWLKEMLFLWDSTHFAAAHPHWHGLACSVAGFVVGGGSVWLVRLAGFWVLKQEAMGFGDVVLMAMVGSVIGWQPVLVVFFIAPVLAIFAALGSWIFRREREIPYGPWLSLATVILLLGWNHIWPYAERIFDMGPFLIVMGVFMFVALMASLQLIQIVKRIFGIARPADELLEGEWSSADHLMYYNGERPDEQTGQWSRSNWPGQRTGQGTSQYHQWRHGNR
ncbi:MAG: prepilin peptidase [Planctomycetaceae bacterium]